MKCANCGEMNEPKAIKCSCGEPLSASGSVYPVPAREKTWDGQISRERNFKLDVADAFFAEGAFAQRSFSP